MSFFPCHFPFADSHVPRSSSIHPSSPFVFHQCPTGADRRRRRATTAGQQMKKNDPLLGSPKQKRRRSAASCGGALRKRSTNPSRMSGPALCPRCFALAPRTRSRLKSQCTRTCVPPVEVHVLRYLHTVTCTSFLSSSPVPSYPIVPLFSPSPLPLVVAV